MTTHNTYQPNVAIHPGHTLLGMLEALNMSQVELAERTGLTTKTINEIVQEKNPITSETAIKLASVFGTSSAFWGNLQKNYEVTLARLEEQELLKNEASLVVKFGCYQEIAKLGFVPKTNKPIEKAKALLNFFGVSSLELVPTLHATAFRKTGKAAKQSPESLAAWLRCGELRAREIKLATFDKDKLLESIQELRSLTRKKPEEFADKMVEICASAGVAVVVTPHFKSTCVNAATRWLNADQALVQLSLRWKYSDIFWFNFFHELGHVLKHGKKEQFLEMEKNIDNPDKEKEADTFAQEVLIPRQDFARFMDKGDLSRKAISDFADGIGTSVSVVAGRLAHEINDFRPFTKMRDRFEFKKELERG